MGNIVKNVKDETQFLTPGPQPNGLQAVADGVWVIDQQNQQTYKLSWSDGKVLHQAPTVAAHTSGITWDGFHLWVASTYVPQVLLQVNVATGKEVRRLASPGVETGQGPHELAWIRGFPWVTVPSPVNKTFQLEPESGRLRYQFTVPDTVPHGLAWDGECIWCAERQARKITGYNLAGKVIDELHLIEGPDPRRAGSSWSDIVRRSALVLRCLQSEDLYHLHLAQQL